MFKNIADILKSFEPKIRLRALVILLSVLFLVNLTNDYFKKSDCSSLQIQIDNLTKSQATIINTNEIIMQKNKELTEGYLKLDSMLTKIKPDTVYINFVAKPNVERVSAILDTSMVLSACVKKISNPIVENKKITHHNNDLLNAMHKVITKNLK